MEITKKDLIIILLLAVCFIININIFRYKLEIENQNITKEHKCIAEYISLGIERKDILTGNGTCWIKEK